MFSTTKAYTAQQVRAMETPLLERNVPLMQQAAQTIAQYVSAYTTTLPADRKHTTVVVLVGSGNNGGDGLHAASYLAQAGLQVHVILTSASRHRQGYELWLETVRSRPDCRTVDISATTERDTDALALLCNADIILDALVGIGGSGGLRGAAGRIVQQYLTARAEHPQCQVAHVVAVDTPSGIGVDDGSAEGIILPADVTLMLGALKPCVLLLPACALCGQVVACDIGLDSSVYTPAVELVDARLASQTLPIPRISDTKYTRGVAGLVTGSVSYPGAALLSTQAAVLSGAGMVRYCGPANVSHDVIVARPEVVAGIGRVQSWTLGSGVPDAAHATDNTQRDRIADILSAYAETKPTEQRARTTDTDQSSPKSAIPCVVDAGALDLLPARVGSQVMLTPHAGECALALQRYGYDINAAQVGACPYRAALELHRCTGATVLLKGAATVVVGEDSEGLVRCFVASAAPSWLATAGAGDVLAGILGAFTAQVQARFEQEKTDVPWTAPSWAQVAAVGAYVHGLAASLASESGSMLSQPCDFEQAIEHIRNFEQQSTQRNLFSSATPTQETSTIPRSKAVGHPIAALDVALAVPQALAQVFSYTSLYE